MKKKIGLIKLQNLNQFEINEFQMDALRGQGCDCLCDGDVSGQRRSNQNTNSGGSC